jgi:DDE family transposase
VQERESAELAADLVRKAVWAEGCLTRPLVLHADDGIPMKGATMKATLERLGVIASYSRPRVSDDNPFSEALFRTCKYRPGWPTSGFASKGDAQRWVANFVSWYCTAGPRPSSDLCTNAWRRGTKGPLAARFAAVRVRVGDGAVWGNNRHLPGEEVWLVGEWRPSGERKYHLSNLPPETPLRDLAAAIKARWVCEQAHRQLKQELGLGHFEGRSWTGLHRHALMACIAFAYLQHLRFKAVHRRGKKAQAAHGRWTAAAAEPARRAPRRHGKALRAARRTGPMSALLPGNR